MEQWEIDYRKELEETLGENLYQIGAGDFIAQTGKRGYIDYQVALRRQSYEVFGKPALEKRLQELTQIPEVGQLDLSSFPDIFLKTGVPVPDKYKWEVMDELFNFETNPGILAQIEQVPTEAYEKLTPEKVEEIIKGLYATVPTSENQEKL